MGSGVGIIRTSLKMVIEEFCLSGRGGGGVRKDGGGGDIFLYIQ